MATATLVDYYEILEVTRSASAKEIQTAIKQQRRTWVKRQQAPSKERQREAEDRVNQIDEAERTLLNDARRKEYDQQLANYQPPAPEPGPRAGGSADWLDRAKQFLTSGDAHSAAYAARQATDQHGANHEAWAVRARSSVLVGRPDDAVFEYSEALRIKPDADEYNFDLGSVHESNGRWNDAMRCYEQASRLVPDNPLYRVAVASVFLNNNVPERALPILEEVHKSHPDVEPFNFYLAWALNDSTTKQWTHLRDGSVTITRPEQIALTRTHLRRAQQLKFDDDELRSNLAHNLRVADAAEQPKFRFPGLSLVGVVDSCQGMFMMILLVGFFWIGIPAIGFAINPFLGILVTGGMGWLFYTLAWQPGWKRTAKDAQGLQA